MLASREDPHFWFKLIWITQQNSGNPIKHASTTDGLILINIYYNTVLAPHDKRTRSSEPCSSANLDYPKTTVKTTATSLTHTPWGSCIGCSKATPVVLPVLSLSWSGTLCSAGEDHGQSIAAADVIRSTVLPVLILAIKARGGICFRTQCPIVVRSPASKLSPVASPPFDPKHPCFTHGGARVGCRPSCS